MYVPKYTRVHDSEVLIEFMKEHPFAVIVTHDDKGLFANHLPLMPERSSEGLVTLVGHLARNNPHFENFKDGKEVLVIFHGPHAYISPSIYASPLNVPTWNYTAVHAYCTPQVIEDEARIEEILKKSVAFFERNNSQPWDYELPQKFKSLLIKAIAGVNFRVQRVEGKFKLSQNRSETDYQAVLSHFQSRDDQTARELLDLMNKTSPFQQGDHRK